MTKSDTWTWKGWLACCTFQRTLIKQHTKSSNMTVKSFLEEKVGDGGCGGVGGRCCSGGGGN